MPSGSATRRSGHPTLAASTSDRAALVSSSAAAGSNASTLDKDRNLVGMDPLVGECALASVAKQEHQVHEAMLGDTELAPQLRLVVLRAIHEASGEPERRCGEI